MKCIVKEVFYDKFDVNRSYAPGDIVDWEDQDRIDDCVERGLIKVCDMEPPADPDPEDHKTGHLAKEGLEDMKVEDLKKLAAAAGIDADCYKKKTDLIEAILNAE